MQHHIDEFTVSDVRHTLGEVLRVVSHRRWHFLIPFGVAICLALLASFWIPRKFTATTVIKREHDPVLASMMGRNWTEPYGEIRGRMLSTLTDTKLIVEVLDELDLPPNLARFDRGELTPDARNKREKLAKHIADGLRTSPIEGSKNRDVVELSLTLPDAEQAGTILGALRDKYIAKTRKQTQTMLRSAQSFFQAESERCRLALGDLQKSMMEFDLKYPGIDPNTPDPNHAQQASLLADRIELERQRENLLVQRDRLQHALSRLAETDELDPSASAPSEEPNPRYAELLQEIEKIESEISDNRRLKLMTEAHPSIIRLRRTLQLRQEALDSTPPYVPSTSIQVMGAAIASRTQAESQLAEVEASIAATESRFDQLSAELAEIDKRRVQIAGHRPAYLKLRERADRLHDELASWQANLGPIAHLLAVENSNRALHFETVEDIAGLESPTSPDVWIVLLACLGIGAGVGAITVLVFELLDRSFRTVRNLGSTLGIPVIESIDEILTSGTRRKRLMNRMILLPGATVALFATASLAGVMAYRSLTQAQPPKSVPFTTASAKTPEFKPELLTQTESEPWESSRITVCEP